MKSKQVFYDATSMQIQSWKYHTMLDNAREHEIIVFEEIFKGYAINLFEDSIEILVNRHESLRTCFKKENGNVKQCVMPYSKPIFSPFYYDLCYEEVGGNIISKVLSEFKLQLKKLDTAPLFRCAIFKLSDDTHYFCMLLHHIICDDWSISIIKRELNTLYSSLLNGTYIPIPPLRMQLKDYALFQTNWLKKNRKLASEYWANKLGDFRSKYIPKEKFASEHYALKPDSVVDIFTKIDGKDDFLNILNNSRSACYKLVADPISYSEIAQLASYCNSIIPATIIASLKLLFLLVAEKPKIIIAMPVSDRQFSNTDSIIGHLIGGGYLHNSIDIGMTAKDIVKSTFIEILESTKNIIYDHDEMQLNDPSLRTNCDLYINHINKTKSDYRFNPARVENRHILSHFEYYALSFVVEEYQNGLSCEWRYNTTLFSPGMIEYISKIHLLLLKIMHEDPNLKTSAIITRIRGKIIPE